jgi:hypothetical protein
MEGVKPDRNLRLLFDAKRRKPETARGSPDDETCATTGPELANARTDLIAWDDPGLAEPRRAAYPGPEGIRKVSAVTMLNVMMLGSSVLVQFHL